MFNFIKSFFNNPQTILEMVEKRDIPTLKEYVLGSPEKFQNEFNEYVESIYEKMDSTFFEEAKKKFPKEFQFINALSNLMNKGKFKFSPVFFRSEAVESILERHKDKSETLSAPKIPSSEQEDSNKTKPLSKKYNLNIPPKRSPLRTPRLTSAMYDRNHREVLHHLVFNPHEIEELQDLFHCISSRFLREFEEYIDGFKEELAQYPDTDNKNQFLRGLDEVLYAFKTVQVTDFFEYKIPCIPTSRNPEDGTLNWQLTHSFHKRTFDFSVERNYAKSILVILLYVLQNEQQLSEKYDLFFIKPTRKEIDRLLSEIYNSSDMTSYLYQKSSDEMSLDDTPEKQLILIHRWVDGIQCIRSLQWVYSEHFLSQMRVYLQGKEANLAPEDKENLDNMMSKDIPTLITEYFEK